MPDCRFDVVLLGGTGFTGALTASYLARHVPSGCRWALAGRNPARLAAVADRLGPDVALVTADVTDNASMRDLAESTRVLATTVGPYLEHGEPAVAACAAAGTDYVDLTGEPEFVDRMYLAHHDRAVETGSRLVHCCGFDSIPHDLGVLFTIGLLPSDQPLRVRGYVRASGAFSGGTFHSAITAMSRARHSVAAARDRRRAEPVPTGRRVRTITGRPSHAEGHDGWAVPLPTIDPQIVARSARALDRYGPDFSYSHYLALDHLPVALAGVAGAGAVFGLAQIPPARRLMLSRVDRGDGPSEAKRAASWFRVWFVGEARDGQRVVTEVAGGDPGYDETAKMLAESALCLAFDDIAPTRGQVTTAVAMGAALTTRLIRAGITFTVLP